MYDLDIDSDLDLDLLVRVLVLTVSCLVVLEYISLLQSAENADKQKPPVFRNIAILQIYFSINNNKCTYTKLERYNF